MDKEFFKRKIVELTDDKLLDLLQKSSGESNSDIFELAKEEAARRNLKFELTDKVDENTAEPNDEGKLRKWNWGAFLLAPIWALANKLELWAILSFIPFVNIPVAFYLGFKGNKIAFEKSRFESVDDFMVIQKNWGLWAVRFYCFGFLIGLVALMIDAVIG